MRVKLQKAAQPRRRLKRGNITHVSLCRRGKNLIPVLMKGDGTVVFETVSKMNREGLLHALVYVPERVDADRDVADVAAIKSFAHGFLANGGNIDVEHDGQPLGPEQVQIAEHFIIQKAGGDPRFAGWRDAHGEPVDETGAWAMVLKVLDPELRAAYDRGDWNGVSLFGRAEAEMVGKSAERRKINPSPNQEDDDMTPEQIQELAQKVAETTAAAVAKALKPTEPAPQPKPEQKPPEAKPVFAGDPRDEEALAKFEEECLLKSLDLSTPEGMKKWREHLAKSAPKPKPKPKEGEDEPNPNADRIAALEKELADLRKASSAPDAPAEGEGKKPVMAGLAKSEAEQWQKGRDAMRAFQKKNRGILAGSKN